MSIKSFFQHYAEVFARIPGWFSLDAYVLMCLYHQLALPPGDVLEIGVFQGLSAIGVAALRGPNRRFFAVDSFRAPILNFEPQEIRERFFKHMREFYPTLDFMTLLETRSNALTAETFPTRFSLVHLDGDHTAEGVLHDLELSHAVLEPGGLLVMDDFYNPMFPGVSEALHRFQMTHPGHFRALAYGIGKLLLQKEPATTDLHARVLERFPRITETTVPMWGVPVRVYPNGLAMLFDLERSTPHNLVMNPAPAVRADLQTDQVSTHAGRGEKIWLPVRITNHCSFAFQGGVRAPIQLSYHVCTRGGEIVRYENPRSSLNRMIEPEQTATVSLMVCAPETAGSYDLVIDLLWEGVTWFQDRGNRVATVRLDVM